MNRIRRLFSFVLVAIRIAGFIATITLHGGDILNLVRTRMNLIHFTLHTNIDRS